MSDDLTAVRAAPDETGDRETVDRRPRHLVGEEIVGTDQLHDLRQTARIPKNVRKPDEAGSGAAQHLKRLLAENKTSRQCFTARQLRVAFDKKYSGRFPLSRFDAPFHSLEQFRRPPGNGLVGGRLTMHESKLRIGLHQSISRRKRMNGLRFADSLRPQPHQIDVRMPGQYRFEIGRRITEFLICRRETAPQFAYSTAI